MHCLIPSAKNLLLFSCFLLLSPSCRKVKGYYGSKGFEKVERHTEPSDIVLPEGYKIEVVARGLNFPTALTFDENGEIYVIESGYSYGEIFTSPRLLRLRENGVVTELAKGEKNGPWTSVDYHKGHFYISEGGVMKGGKILKVAPGGPVTNLTEGLPSYGDHHTNGAVVGKDGYVYFGQGSATNSGVVGKDNLDFGWLGRKRDFHDIPCEDIILSGENFKTENYLSADLEKVETGAYVAFGTRTSPGQIVKGRVPCTGAVMRVSLNGGSPELVAWGFRNPYGLCFGPDGNLYVTDNGYDKRGSRPVIGGGDHLWKVTGKQWFGWPDFSGADSLADDDYQIRKARPKSVLQKHPGTPPAPVAIFGVHSSSDGIDFSRSETFGYKGKAFVAQFGDMSPNVGRVYAPVGFKVVMVDTENGNIFDFAVNKGKSNGPATMLKSGGLERPVSVKFSPDGSALYIVDFGVMEIPDKNPAPKQYTGVIWKISKKS